MKRGTRVALGTALAAAAGYVAGILTAPKSGKETRQDIHDKAVQAKVESERRLKDLSTELNEVITRAKTTAKSAEATTKTELHKALDKAVDTKHKAREILSALHEGETAAKDLQKAVKDVQKAIEHLKKYLEKTPAKKSTRT